MTNYTKGIELVINVNQISVPKLNDNSSSEFSVSDLMKKYNVSLDYIDLETDHSTVYKIEEIEF
jgi:hypothetical protein